MRAAPVVNFLIEIFNVQPIERFIIFFAESITAFVVLKQPDQPVFHVLARLCEFGFRNGRVRRGPSVILRLVGEKTDKFFAEIFLEPRVILLVRLFDESVRNGGI